jgi:hypothetical protein
MSSSRTIPSPIRREVRRRSGFGCVICGMPIIQYDHIVEWSKVRGHQASNITALCPLHHADKTHGRMPIEELLRANKSPHNLSGGRAAAYKLFYGARPIRVFFGSIEIITRSGERSVPVVVDSVELVSWRVEDGVYLLSAEWHDDDGNVLFKIVDNELTVNARNWDVEFVANKLTIRSGLGIIKLCVKFDPPESVTFLSGSFSKGRHNIEVSPTALKVNGGIMSHLRLVGGGAGLVVGENKTGLSAIINIV